MSVVVVNNHNESIYDLLRTECQSRPKSPMFITKTEKELKRLHSSAPKTHATMGYPDVPLKSTKQFLKQGEGIHIVCKKQTKSCLNSSKLPSLPNKDPNYPKKLSKRDFEVRNKKFVNEMKSNMLKEVPVVVDSSKGHLSGVYKFKWVYGKSFGNVPRYLARRMEDMGREEKHYRHALETEEPLCTPITSEEREQLLQGLKKNWAQLQKEFLLLPMLIDTVPKIIRKTRLETQLRQLESDIRMVEENPHIYIYNSS